MNVRHLTLALVVGLFAGCGQTAAPCGPSTCAGCCTAARECVLAPSAVACGGSGSACMMCTAGQTCVSGLCAAGNTGGGSGNTGGGGATGGGATGGGATGGGGGSMQSNSVTGAPGGRAMTIVSGAAQQTSGFSNRLTIRLSEHALVCSATGGHGLAKSGLRMLDLFIPLVQTGTQTAIASVISPDCFTNVPDSGGTHNPVTQVESAMNVSVTLTNVTGSVQGTFSGTFASGAPFSGVIDAPYCSFVFTSAGAVTCQF